MRTSINCVLQPIGLLAILGLIVYGGITLFCQDRVESEVFKCYKELSDNGKRCVQTSVLKEGLRQVCDEEGLAAAEEQLIEWIDEEVVLKLNASSLVPALIDSRDGILDYPFDKLQDKIYFNVESSTDGNIKGFAWSSDSFGHDYTYRLFIKDGDRAIEVDYGKLFSGNDIYDRYEKHHLKFFTLDLGGKDYYLIQSINLNSYGSMVGANIALFTLEDGELKREELIDGISVEFANDDDERDWIFDYDHSTNTLYVPIIDKEGDNLTDEYLLYKWNGKVFSYIGKGNHWKEK